MSIAFLLFLACFVAASVLVAAASATSFVPSMSSNSLKDTGAKVTPIGAIAATTLKAAKDANANGVGTGQNMAEPAVEGGGASGLRAFQKTLKSADGKTYKVKVIASASAGIPEDVQLSVMELNQIPAGWDNMEKRLTIYKGRPYATEKLLDENQMRQYGGRLSQALSLGEDSVLMWNKLLNVTFVRDGTVFEPVGSVLVEVETDAIAAPTSDALEVALLADENSQAYTVRNETGTKKDETDKEPKDLCTRVVFSANRLGDLALAQVSQKKFEWNVDKSVLSVYAPRRTVVSASELDPNIDLGEDRTATQVLAMTVDPARAFGNTLWIRCDDPKEGSAGTIIRGYRMGKDGDVQSLFGPGAANGLVAFDSSDVIALESARVADAPSANASLANAMGLRLAPQDSEDLVYYISTIGEPIQVMDVLEEAGVSVESLTIDNASLDQAPGADPDPLGCGQSDDGTWLLTCSGSFEGERTLTVSGTQGEEATPVTVAVKLAYGIYNITWDTNNGDQPVTTEVARGQVPSYGEQNPTKPDDDQYKYTFQAWNPEPVEATRDVTYTATYAATPLVCQIEEDGENVKFTTIRDAVSYIGEHSLEEATIEMLVDYTMPASDAVVLDGKITITSASGTKTITRGDDLVAAPMFTNSADSTLVLGNIVLDGNNGVQASEPLVSNSGTVTLGEGVTLRNARSSGNGGAIYSVGGSITINGATIQGNEAANGGAIYCVASGSTQSILSIQSGSISGNKANASGDNTGNGGAIYVQSGSIDITGGALSNNEAANGGALYLETGRVGFGGSAVAKANRAMSGNGGALYAASALIEVGGSAILGGATAEDGNTASGSGGAIYAGTATLNASAGALQNNTADSGNGGAACVNAGNVNISGATLSSNKATSGNGGAVYSGQATVTVSGAAELSSNEAKNGGALYAQNAAISVAKAASGDEAPSIQGNTASEDGGGAYAAAGALTVSAGAMQSNVASRNGGGVYAGTGTLTLNGGSLQGNTATNGVGGAAYAGGGATLSNTLLTGNNQAKNGSALFVAAETASVGDGTTITGNVSTEGGAVGAGAVSVRLLLSGNVQIANNKLGSADATQQSNVYLDQDADTLIREAGLANNASVGVYPAGAEDSALFKHRGVPSAKFATFTNSDNASRFTNDRTPTLAAAAGQNNKIVWKSPIKVRAYYVDSFASGFPPAVTGTSPYSNDDYNPPAAENGASEIAVDLYGSLPRAYGDSGFACAFANGATTFDEYVTQVNWNASSGQWCFQKRDGGQVVGNDTLVLYYSKPSYIAIENNTDHKIDLGGLSVLGHSAINSTTAAGYGYVVAINGTTLPSLRPITAEDLQLERNRSIRLLFPGANGQAYSFEGKFEGSITEPVRLRRTGVQEEQISAQEAMAGFSRSGAVAAAAGGTTSIVFGDDKPICKIVMPEVQGLDESKVAGHTDPDTSGNVEYLFSTLRQAVAFVQTYETQTQKTATIQMLVDYLMPGNDTVDVPNGYNLTFTTAKGGVFEYEHDPSDPNPRATISRDASNLSSFISAVAKYSNGTKDERQDYGTTLTVEDLNFDGKALVGSGDGGAVAALNCKTTIRNADFKNFNALNGGAVYVQYSTPNNNTYLSSDTNERTTFSVTNANFKNCVSSSTTNRQGGGAIWTNAKHFVLTGNSAKRNTMDGCSAVDQGGAVFHRVDKGYTVGTSVVISNYEITNCEANAAGALESDAQEVTVNNCYFAHCKSKRRSGGAMNTYTYDELNPAPATKPCTVTVEDCDFVDCHANANGSNGFGGGLRSNATTTNVRRCSFNNTTASNAADKSRDCSGGAVSASNTNGAYTEIVGCSFKNASTAKMGGAVYCASLSLVVQDCNAEEDKEGISGCTAGNGGGAIYHSANKNNSRTTVSNTVITGCTTPSVGGGIFSNTRMLEISGGVIQNNSATGNGGGVFYGSGSTGSMTLAASDVTVSGNSSGTEGGGIYTTVKNVTITGGQISGNTAAIGGGGLALRNDTATLGISDCTIADNRSNGGDGGGGILSNANSFTVTGCTIQNNTATGNGGGISYVKTAGAYGDNNPKLMITRGTVSGNVAGDKGGGIYSLATMGLANTSVTDNRLSTNAEQNAAGVYMNDSRTLMLGTTGSTEADTTNIMNNRTASGTASNLRLWSSDAENNNAAVKVRCNLGGNDAKIYVVNAKKLGTQFGSSLIANPSGFIKDPNTGRVPVFEADDGTLYGTINRLDTSGKKIVWATDPVCKISTPDKQLLYFKVGDQWLPAVFDNLDNGTTAAGNTGAFTMLKTARDSLKLYVSNGAEEYTEYKGNEFHVKMLVQNYTANSYITTNLNNQQKMKIVLTTASKDDGKIDGYPYRGSAGTKCTIMRGFGFNDSPLITAKVPLTLINVTLDGGSNRGIEATCSGGLLQNGKSLNDTSGSKYTTIEVGAGATLQNSVTTGDGGAVYLTYGNFKLNGGTIRNCGAPTGNGGAVCMLSWYKTDTPVRGMLDMLSGTITQCSAHEGGALYLGNKSRTTISGGSITSNRATSKGGGIAFDSSDNVACYFGGAPTIRGNKLNGNECNVELDRDSSKLINSNGLEEGAYIGIYVPAGVHLYDKHGGEDDPFGTYASGTSTTTLHGFVNDINQLRGGLKKNDAANTIYWVKVCSLRVNKALVSGLSTDAWKSFAFVVELLNADGQIDTTANVTYSGVTFTGGVSSRITMLGGQSRLLQGMPSGQRFRVREELSGADAAVFDSNPASRFIEGTVGANESLPESDPSRYITDVTVTNTRKTGELEVSKAVVSDEDADKTENFTFAIQLRGLTRAAGNATYDGVSFTNGEGTITLADGQSKTISGLPVGASYTVREVLGSRGDYYSTTPAVTQNGTIATQKSMAEFTNTKKVTFQVSKHWDESVSNYNDLEVDFELFKVKPGISMGEGKDAPPASFQTQAVPTLFANDPWDKPGYNGNDQSGVIPVPQPNGFFYSAHHGAWYYMLRPINSRTLNEMAGDGFVQPNEVIEFSGRVLDDTYFYTGTDRQIHVYDNAGLAERYLKFGDIIKYDNKFWLLTVREGTPVNPIAESGRWHLLGEAAAGDGDVTVQYTEQGPAEVLNTTLAQTYGYQVDAVPSTQGNAKPYFTLNRDNNWTMTLADELEYGYTYYAVERRVRPYGDYDTNLISSYTTTYNYVQDESVVINNVPAGSREVILRKVGQAANGNYVSLGGARFRIYHDNGTEQGGSEITDGRPADQDYYESQAPSGVYFVGTLPYGKYRVVETDYPSGYAPTNYDPNDPQTWYVYELTVDENGARIEGPRGYDGSEIVLPASEYAVKLSHEASGGAYYVGQEGSQSVVASLQHTTDGGTTYSLHTRDVSWSSSNPSVVEIDANGSLKFKSAGTATITASSTDEGDNPVEASVLVRVVSEYEVSLNTTSVSGLVGQAPKALSFTYRYHGSAADATSHLSYNVGNTQVASASTVGGVPTIGFVGPGKTTVDVLFDGVSVGTVEVDVAQVQLQTTVLANKTVGVTEQNAIQVSVVGNDNLASGAAAHLRYAYPSGGNDVVLLQDGNASAAYLKLGTSSVDVYFDDVRIGTVVVSVTNSNTPLTGAPTEGSHATATQAAGSAVEGWANGNTWRTSADGTYMYVESDSDKAIAIVYYDGHYYVPHAWGAVSRIPAVYFHGSFSTSDLTDGATHTYVDPGNQYNTVSVSWTRTQ